DVRGQVEAAQGEQKEDAEIDVYTHVYLNEAGDGYSKYEEVAEEVVPGSEAEYPLEECPYIPVRMVRIDGESYGRSYVEEYLGDLKSLENLQESIVKMAMITAKVIGLVDPAGITQVRRLTAAQSGAFVPGRKQD
ncbi:portal protein, partial [Escherichia coli]